MEKSLPRRAMKSTAEEAHSMSARAAMDQRAALRARVDWKRAAIIAARMAMAEARTAKLRAISPMVFMTLSRGFVEHWERRIYPWESEGRIRICWRIWSSTRQRQTLPEHSIAPLQRRRGRVGTGRESCRGIGRAIRLRRL